MHQQLKFSSHTDTENLSLLMTGIQYWWCKHLSEVGRWRHRRV